MKKAARNELLERAEKTNDLQLYKALTGGVSLLDYLIDFVEKNELGGLAICGETLSSVLHANKARRKKVASWYELDTNEAYKTIHQKEIAVIDEQSELMLIEIFDQLDDLKAQAAADVTAAEKAAADRAAKRAAKKAAKEAAEKAAQEAE